MTIIKKDPKLLINGIIKTEANFLFAINWPNPECRTVTVGYFKDGNFFDRLDNVLYYDDGFEPRCVSVQFVEWWAEIPKFEKLEV